MIRLIMMAFALTAASSAALTLASSALAMPSAQFSRSSDMVITVRETCGPGMHRVNGTCITTPARRAVRRCVAGVTC